MNEKIVWVVMAYLAGSIPFGLLVARWMGAGDIRQSGSGNIGATNVLRTAGPRAGAMTLLLDMIKGGAPVGVAMGMGVNDPEWLATLALAAFLGHLYPVWLRFRGGKGVATGLGAVLAWQPWAGVVMALGWLLTAWCCQRSSLASLTAFTLLPIWLAGWGESDALPWAVLMVALVYWRHRENLRRLLTGREPRLTSRSS